MAPFLSSSCIYFVPSIHHTHTGWNDEEGAGFDGLLADIRIYDGLLSPSEIQALAATKVDTCSTQPAQLQAWYPFKTDLKDASGNGYDGSLVDASVSLSSSLSCGYLDLSSIDNGYVDLGPTIGTAVVAELSSFSLATWVNFNEYTFYSG